VNFLIYFEWPTKLRRAKACLHSVLSISQAALPSDESDSFVRTKNEGGAGVWNTKKDDILLHI
jgi:hypothetical protein